MDPDAGGQNSYRAFFENVVPFLKKKGKDLKVSIAKDEIFYKMNHRKRGYAVIFNHLDFDPKLKSREKFECRDGTEVDCQRLLRTYELLGLEVKVYSESKVEKIKNVLDEMSRKDFKNCDCLILTVLSHGKMDKIFAWDDWYNLDLLIETFTPDKCPTLVGKPKILVLQLCQGKRIDVGCEVRVQTDGIEIEDVQTDSGQKESTLSYRLPLYADFLIACSTSRGYYSFRHTKNGSYYIQVLCEELDLHSSEKDILTILTFVNRRMAVEFESYNLGEYHLHKRKQMPSFTSMLTRLLVFQPK